MRRNEFIKRATLGGITFSFLGGKRYNVDKINELKCRETPELEEGPFPTKEPLKFISKNIVSDRIGNDLSINVLVFNINDKCKPLKNAWIDIWHCDHKGEYSEYGGSGSGFGPPNGMPPPDRKGMKPPPPPHKGDKRPPFPPPGMGGGMQATDHTTEHYLRGRQQTDDKGLVSYQSKYPGWYNGRAPHIHLHVFNEKGKSLLISQIAFPENINKEVYTQGVYAARGLADTSNINDHVFSGSIANELAIISGNIKDGFILTHSIYVKS